MMDLKLNVVAAGLGMVRVEWSDGSSYGSFTVEPDVARALASSLLDVVKQVDEKARRTDGPVVNGSWTE